MTRVYVGIGSNIEPRAHIPKALALLRARFGAVIVSPVYSCPAVGFSGADFLNLVVGFDTELDPPMLIQALHCIEEHCGRKRDTGLHARSMDLDLLLYGDMVSSEAGVPRDDVLRYAFTLKPLADIAAASCHPVDGRSYTRLWDAFDPRDQPLTRVALDSD